MSAVAVLAVIQRLLCIARVLLYGSCLREHGVGTVWCHGVHIYYVPFGQGQVRYGDRASKSMPIFEYITRSTQNRPRDYIRYIQVCASQALEEGREKITPQIVKKEGKSFSNYLKTEIEDEIHGAIPEIKRILNIFTKLRKQTLSIGEFRELYESEVASGNIPKRDYQFVLEILFMFSVIGNAPKQKTHQVFRYKDKEARLNMNENIIVHRGLFRALQIL